MANARRANIPLYRQTDPKYFPDYEFREYPKEMKDENGESIINNPVYLMTTPRDPEAAPKLILRADGKPILIGGEPTIVNNKEEEDEFYRQHPELKKAAQERAKIVSFPISGQADALEAENARMRAVLEENARLKALLGTSEAKPERKKPGRKPKIREPEPQAVNELPEDLK